MSFWDKTFARTLLVAPPAAILLAFAAMLGIRRSTALSTGDFVGSVVGLSIALTIALGLLSIVFNAIWWWLRPQDWR